jgi:putative transposase
MTNHFHLVLQTPEPNLSRGMKWLLGSYVVWFNKRHGRTGHLFGDRFHSDLIEKESYLTEAVRYVVLNPVRAGMVERPEDYRWSSYRATAGLARAPEWLALETLAPFFGEPSDWQANYRAYVAEKIGSDERLWDKLENQIYLGSEAWMKEVRKIVESKMRSDDHPRPQREVGRPKMAAIVAAVAGRSG